MKRLRKADRPYAVLIPLVVTGGAIWVNLGAFFWGSYPGWYHVLASAVYLLVWGGYRVLCSGKAARWMFCAFGIGTLLSGLLALPVAVWDWGIVAGVCMAPTLLLSLLFVTPMYGMIGLVRGHALRWTMVLVLGAAWTAACVLPAAKRKLTV